LVADPYSILVRWTIYFSKLFHVHGVYDVRHIEVHTTEPLVPETSAYELQLPIEKIKVKNHQVSIKFHQNCLRQAVEQFATIYVNLLIIFGIR